MIILIAAIGRNRELGKSGNLLWKLPSDLKRFKETTLNSPIIMGKKTFDSIGRLLPKRVNIIVTRDTDFHQEGAVVTHSVEQALSVAHNVGTEKIFVIGGGEIFKQTLPLADELDLTLVDAEDKDADVFFPEFEKDFKKVMCENPGEEENTLRYQCCTFSRK